MSAARSANFRRMRAAALCALAVLAVSVAAGAAEFGSPGGPVPGNLDEALTKLAVVGGVRRAGRRW